MIQRTEIHILDVKVYIHLNCDSTEMEYKTSEEIIIISDAIIMQ